MSGHIETLIRRVEHAASVLARRTDALADMMEMGGQPSSVTLAAQWQADAAADLASWCRELEAAFRKESGPVFGLPHYLDIADVPESFEPNSDKMYWGWM